MQEVQLVVLSKRGALIVAAVVASCAWLSYQADWSHGVSGDPHTAPPALQVPAQVIEETAGSADEVETKMREAFLSGRPVRVEYSSPAGLPEVKEEYWCRAVTERDRVYGARQIARVRKTTDKLFNLDEPSPVKREQEMSRLFKIRAMTDAAAVLLNEGNAFVTKGLISSLRSDDEWHYWNLLIYYKDEGSRALYVPIDLSRFPDVKNYRQKSRDIDAIAATEAAYEWNSIDYSIRRKLVDAAAAARRRISEMTPELKELESQSANQLSAVQAARRREMSGEVSVLQDVVTKVPPYVEEPSLDVRLR
jgi:hypothetical protein